MHVHTDTYTHHCGQAPSLEWLPPSFCSTPLAVNWLAVGWVRLTAEAETRRRRGADGARTHTHTQDHHPPTRAQTHTHTHTHTHRGNPSFSLFNTRSVFSYTPLLNYSQHNQVWMCCAPDIMRWFWTFLSSTLFLRVSRHFIFAERSLGFVSAKVRFPPVCY